MLAVMTVLDRWRGIERLADVNVEWREDLDVNQTKSREGLDWGCSDCVVKREGEDRDAPLLYMTCDSPSSCSSLNEINLNSMKRKLWISPSEFSPFFRLSWAPRVFLWQSGLHSSREYNGWGCLLLASNSQPFSDQIIIPPFSFASGKEDEMGGRLEVCHVCRAALIGGQEVFLSQLHPPFFIHLIHHGEFKS